MISTNSAQGRAAVLAQYDEFAVRARSAAAREALDNVRQKHLTSAVSWEQLAANGRKMEGLRDRRVLEQLSAVVSAEIGLETAGELQASPTWPAIRSRTLVG